MSSSNKRRRVSDDQSQPELIPSVMGSSNTHHGATTTSGEVQLLSVENWEEIPEILFVKMQKESSEEVEEALRDLAYLMDGEDANAKRYTREAFRFGAPGHVVLTMKKFQYNVNVQDYGCQCLQNLSFLEEKADIIIQTGGMEAVINALKINPDSRNVQKFGVCTLQNLFAEMEDEDDDTIVKQACKRFVNDWDGLQLILATMENFFADEKIVGLFCGVFWNLSQVKEFHKQMKAAGVMGAVGKALDKYADNKDVTKYAIRCMQEMMKDFS